MMKIQVVETGGLHSGGKSTTDDPRHVIFHKVGMVFDVWCSSLMFLCSSSSWARIVFACWTRVGSDTR